MKKNIIWTTVCAAIAFCVPYLFEIMENAQPGGLYEMSAGMLSIFQFLNNGSFLTLMFFVWMGGTIYLNFIANTKKKCPKCSEKIQANALKCRYCGHEFIHSKQTIEKHISAVANTNSEDKVEPRLQ